MLVAARFPVVPDSYLEVGADMTDMLRLALLLEGEEAYIGLLASG